MRRSAASVVVGLVVSLGGMACSADDSGGVTMGDEHHTFDPESITVAVGETLTFTNDSDEAHTVTAYEDGIPEGADYFASGGARNEKKARAGVGDGLLSPGETYEVTFDEPGEYSYFCIPHENHDMKGTVIVEE